MAGFAKTLSSIGYLIRETGQALDRLGSQLQGKYGYVEQLSRHRTVMSLLDKQPKIPADAFVAPSAAVIGDVSIGHKSSVWYGAVLRGDVNSISVGSFSNLQDGSIVHVARTNLSSKILPTIIGDRVSVGHNAVIHACTLEDGSYIGVGATVLDGAVIEKGAVVGPGSTVLQNARVPSGQLWAGVPAKFVRYLTAEEAASIPVAAENYARLAAEHLVENAKSFEEIEVDGKVRQFWAEHDDDQDSAMGIIREKPPKPTPISL